MELFISTLSDIGSHLSQHHQSIDPSICLPCLTGHPSLTLTCGHHFCQRCVQRFGRHLGGAEFQLSQCVLCHVANHAPIYIRPSTAGLRILKLESRNWDVVRLAQTIRRLERLLDGPLYMQFDLVIGTGLGKVLAQTMFSEERRVRDVLLHISQFKQNLQECWRLIRHSRPEAGKELRSNRLTILADWYAQHFNPGRMILIANELHIVMPL